jgi:hypothetical protein
MAYGARIFLHPVLIGVPVMGWVTPWSPPCRPVPERGGGRTGGEDAALASRGVRRHAFGMFAVTEAVAAAIRAVFAEEDELSAAIELRRRFPRITGPSPGGRRRRTQCAR